MSRRGRGGQAFPGGCFKCGEQGHWSRECPQNRRGGGRGGRGRGGRGRGRGINRNQQYTRSGVPIGSGGCFKCGEEGHWSRECPYDGMINDDRQTDKYDDFDNNDNYKRNDRSRGNNNKYGDKYDDYDEYDDYGVNDDDDHEEEEEEEEGAEELNSGNDLRKLLISLDDKNYGNYKELRGIEWNFSNNFSLFFDRIQSDPYAPASNLIIRVNNKRYSKIPSSLFNNKIRNIASCDYLTRSFASICGKYEYDRRERGPWSGKKGGDILINNAGQHVIERTSCFITNNYIEIRFDCALPGRGRRIEGRWCADVLCKNLPFVIEKSLIFDNLDEERFINHVNCVEDQEYLRSEILPKLNLIAFIADNAILPRASGVSDKPLTKENGAVPFKYEAIDKNDKLFITGIKLKNNKNITLSGLGIPYGITLIIGGGFHGKSTLLSALEYGIYNHVPGDGREYVVCSECAVKIRSEDGRYINNVNITPFINNLPQNRSCSKFTTLNASGSTSMAANIIENIELNTDLLLVDEDMCATNFMVRDYNMDNLINKNIVKEPITPFISKIRCLYNKLNVSTIMVMGGIGSYFQVADNIILMSNYKPSNVTTKIKSMISSDDDDNKNNTKHHQIREYKMFGKLTPRYLKNTSFSRNMSLSKQLSGTRAKIKIDDKGNKIIFNNDIINLSSCSQIVEIGQMRAISRSLEYIKQKILNSKNVEKYKKHTQHNDDDNLNIADILEIINKDLNYDHITTKLDILNKVQFTRYSNEKSNKLVRPRIQEIAMALNRFKTLSIYSTCDDDENDENDENDKNNNNNNNNQENNVETKNDNE